MGIGSNPSGKKSRENGAAMKEISSQNNFEVLSIPGDQVPLVLEEGEINQSQNQTSEEVTGSVETDLTIPKEGHSPTYLDMAKKKIPMNNSSSHDEDPLERSSKKVRKFHKMVREEEVERLKIQGSQDTIEMSISRNTRGQAFKRRPSFSQIMTFVSWNCKGLGNFSKVEAINDLIRMASPDILLLQEMKIDEDNLMSISNMKWKLNVGKAMSARGTAGGITTLWKENSFSLEDSYIMQHWIFSEIRHTQSKFAIALFNVCVPVNL